MPDITKQQRTLDDLTMIGDRFNQVTRLVSGSPGGVFIQMAPEESWYMGSYAWLIDITVYSDGSFQIEGADEVILDALDEVFERSDYGDSFIEIFNRVSA